MVWGELQGIYDKLKDMEKRCKSQIDWEIVLRLFSIIFKLLFRKLQQWKSQ